jgi:tetratricopeptide (TPR) repeat protein
MNASAYMWKGYYMFWKNRLTESLDCLDNSLKYESDSRVIIRMGDIYAKAGCYSSAWASYKKAMNSITTKLGRFLLLLSLGNLADDFYSADKDIFNHENEPCIVDFINKFNIQEDFRNNYYLINSLINIGGKYKSQEMLVKELRARIDNPDFTELVQSKKFGWLRKSINRMV